MPLSFLQPGMLIGAAAAALPVILHFLSRRRVRRQTFSDLRFLEQAQSRQARSLGVRRWLLLLLRVLALLLVVAGAAGPRWGGLADAGSGGACLIVVDTSASAGARRGAGTVLDAELADAAALIRQLPAGAAVQIITAGSRTAALFGDWLPAGEAAAAALSAAMQTDGSYDLGAVLREAARQVARAPGAPVDLILVGDLQSLPDDPAWPEAARAVRQAREVRVLLREVAPDRGTNGGVVDIRAPGRALRTGETARVEATVISGQAGQRFTLEIDGRPVAEAVVTDAAAGPIALEFALSVPGPGLHAGWVGKESDLLAADDRRPFVLAVPERLTVLIIHGPDRSGDGAAGRGGWRFVAEALAPGEADGPYAVAVQVSDEATTGAIATAAVVVLVDPGPLGRAAQEALIGRVRGGGGVLLAAADPLLTEYLGGTLLPALGLQPGAEARSAAGEGLHARIVDPSHPLFASLDESARATVEDIRWRRWLAVDPAGARVVLELTGGPPLLLERELGDGRVAVLATHLGADAGDLAHSPMALPLLQRLVSWLGTGSGLDGASAALVGQDLRVRVRRSAPSTALADAGALTVAGPGAASTRAADLVWRGDTPVLEAGPADRAGFAVFASAADTLGLVAVAVPPAETLEQRDGAEGWRRRLSSLDLPVAADLSGADPARWSAVLAGRDLAPWAFLLAVALLAVELLVGSGTRGKAGAGS